MRLFLWFSNTVLLADAGLAAFIRILLSKMWTESRFSLVFLAKLTWVWRRRLSWNNHNSNNGWSDERVWISRSVTQKKSWQMPKTTTTTQIGQSGKKEPKRKKISIIEREKKNSNWHLSFLSFDDIKLEILDLFLTTSIISSDLKH